ncbi:MAG: hypothetical protein A4E71_00140 [Smithella sp. PtaU1.Bin162]|nr:MAG: hypothetical protein A4E71_00140 [Smithella sp. PtaU1.Bin162]
MKMQEFLCKLRNTMYGGGTNSGARALLSVLNIYLCYYVVSAAVDIFCVYYWGWTLFGGFLTFGFIFFSFAVLFLFLFPQMPKRFFIAPILYIPTALMLSFPIFLLSKINLTVMDIMLSAFQIIVGAVTLLQVKICCGTWLLLARDLNATDFSGGYLLRLFGGTVLAIVIFISVVFGVFMFEVRYYSSDFIRVTPVSIQFARKTFENKGKQVILCGMSHIASNAFYKGLREKFPEQGSIILCEGVSDSKNLIKVRSRYKGMAVLCGGVMQPEQQSKQNKKYDFTMGNV